MKYYHGTTYQNAKLILEVGYQRPIEPTWYCSMPGYTYCWSGSYFDDFETTLAYAFENAALAAAKQDAWSNALVVFEYDIPSQYVEEDTSAECMDGAVEISNNIMNTHNPTRVFICREGYIPELRLFYMPTTQIYNISVLDDLQQQVLKDIQPYAGGMWAYLMEKFSNWEEISISELQ